MTITATYSPDDNKIRLYATARLGAETYARVRGAGFKWAPKQDLFVAPCWTPEREDLALALAGEIGDDDTSLAERAEERAERFDGYEDNRRRDAEAAHAAVKTIADGIPLGQPILVGHHSERRARRDAEKIENGMRRAVKMWRTAEYWQRRAEGAIAHAKYKERPDVRARRIKTIEADRRRQVKYIAEARTRIRAWALVARPAVPLPAKMAAHVGEDSILNRALFVANYFSAGYGTWSDLKDGKIDPRGALLRSLKANGAIIAYAERWITHFDRRLEYERAMLAADGGTVADQTGPEAGGAVRCWCGPRGGWAYIVKVNKVTVTVLDNWGNGGDHFTRTVPLTDLKGVMSRAEVDAARAAGRLVDNQPDSKGRIQGFTLRADPTPPEPPKEDRVCPDGPTCPDPECRATRHETGLPVADVGADIAAMAATLDAGGVKVATVPQLFPTPADVAGEVARLADIRPGMRVLEPSAGTGSLLGALGCKMFGYKPAPPGHFGARIGAIVAVEINPLLAERLRESFPLTDVHARDFLTLTPADLGTFDRIVMNPPFERGADIRHIERAVSFLSPGGRLVAICAGGPRQREAAERLGLEWRDLPAGSFAAAGTNVHTAIVIGERGGR